MQARSQRPRFWIALQPGIVRIYKIAGLIALTAILVGLIGFLVINIYYFFDHTWVRPTKLTPTHQKVVEASTQLADAKLRASQLAAEKSEIEEQLKEIDRTIKDEDKFIAEVGNAVDAPRSPEQWVLRREVEKAKLDQENLAGKRSPLNQRIESLKLRITDQDAVVGRLAASPYLKAIDGKVVLAFVPNQNLKNIAIGTPLYGCHWGLVWCRKVGTVKSVLDGEVEGIHPHDESIQRGQMLEIDVSSWGANEDVLFAGSKPLVFF